MCVFVCVCLWRELKQYISVCVCVCVFEREREMCAYVYPNFHPAQFTRTLLGAEKSSFVLTVTFFVATNCKRSSFLLLVQIKTEMTGACIL